MHLSLSYPPEKLRNAFIAEYQSCLGNQPSIVTLLNASWLVSVRCFCPVQDIHLVRHSPDLYVTRLAHGVACDVAIELNCEAPVRTRVGNVSRVESEATSPMSLGDHPSNEASERFLPTTICYAEEISAMARGSSNGNLNTEVYITSTPSSSWTSRKRMESSTPKTLSPSMRFLKNLHLVCCIHSTRPSRLWFLLRFNP